MPKIASKFYAGEGVVPIGPVGEPIVAVEAGGDSVAMTKLRERLGFLITQTRIRPERIAVLCSSKAKAKEISPHGQIGSFGAKL